jgi:hypothetical protein
MLDLIFSNFSDLCITFPTLELWSLIIIFLLWLLTFICLLFVFRITSIPTMNLHWGSIPHYITFSWLLKLQRLQNRVLCAIGNLDRQILVPEMGVAFKIPCMYDYITKLCRTQAEVILHHRNPVVHGIGQGQAMHREYNRLKLGGSQAYDRSAD